LGTEHCYLKEFYSSALGTSLARRLAFFGAETKRGYTSTSKVAGVKQYNTAANNWAALIADARQNNHQFQDLWEEHKRRCKLSPLVTFAINIKSAQDVVAASPISQDLRLAVYRYFKKNTLYPMLGLRWRTWPTKPIDGRNLWNPELAEALSLRTVKEGFKGKGRDVIVFTLEEWEAFGIKKLPVGSFVKSGDMYFMPDNPKEKRKSYRALILLETL